MIEPASKDTIPPYIIIQFAKCTQGISREYMYRVHLGISNIVKCEVGRRGHFSVLTQRLAFIGLHCYRGMVQILQRQQTMWTLHMPIYYAQYSLLSSAKRNATN